MKNNTHNRRKEKARSGQTLLLMVMLIAVAITIVLTLAFKSTNQTQVTKLEEESQKGLAAAEAGVEQALSTRQVSGNINIGFSGFTGIASVSTSSPGNTFVSPLLTSDQQYTFYLADYNESSAIQPTPTPPFNNPYNGTLVIYYGSSASLQGCDSFALEITVIFADNSIRRYVADTGNRFGVTNAGDIGQTYNGPQIGGVDFNCSTSTISPISIPGNANLLLIRSFFTPTKIAVVGSASLKSQGKTITSTVNSATGATKKVRLFQSYPQIPTDFFVTQVNTVAGN